MRVVRCTRSVQRHCQAGVFLAYAAPEGVALIDRELYLPKEWTGDSERCREAGVPEEVGFATQPQLARAMLERALAAGVPHAWITADEIYGQERRLRLWWEEQERPFVLAVSSQEKPWIWWEKAPRQIRVDKITERVPEDEWPLLSAGGGSKGERLYEWALVELFRWGTRLQARTACWSVAVWRIQGRGPTTSSSLRRAPPWRIW